MKHFCVLLTALFFLACKKETVPGNAVPTITGFTPTSGGSATVVTITGTNFTGATAVSFGGVAAASFSVVSATAISATVAGGATGSVAVITPAGTASLPGFTYTTNTTQKGLVIHHQNAAQCYGKAVATDAGNNILVAEFFQTNITGKPFSSAGPIDALFSKYDKNGVLIWDRTAGGANSLTTPHGIETDAAGNVYVTGYFGQDGATAGRTISFDTKSITSKSDYDVFLAKYNSGGTVQWALALGNTAWVTEERAWDIAVDVNGNSYICGVFAGSVDFNPLGATPRILTAGSALNSLFLAKYDANGMNLWAVKVDANLGAVMTEAYSAVGLDNNGNVVLGGNYRNAISVGNNNFTSAGGTDILIANYTQANGTLNWAKTFGGTGNDLVSPGALRVNAANEPHFTGRFAGSCNMGGTTITSTAGAVSNLYITALTATGNTKWALAVPSNAGQSGGHRVAFDAAGNVLATGWYAGSANINGNVIVAKTGGNSADVFLAKFSASGVMQWFHSFGSFGYNNPGDLSISAGLSVDGENNAVITGKFYGSDVDWDPSAGELKTSSAGLDDGFIAKYKSDGSLWQKP